MLWLPGAWLPDADCDRKGLEMCSPGGARGRSTPRDKQKKQLLHKATVPAPASVGGTLLAKATHRHMHTSRKVVNLYLD